MQGLEETEPGYKKTASGNIPEEWLLVTIDKLIKRKDDIKTGPFGSSLKKESFVTTGYKVYGQENVIPDDFSIGNYYIPEEVFLKMKKYEVKPKDILISLVGTHGKVSLVPKNIARGIINPRLLKITLNESIAFPEFMKFLLNSEFIDKQIEKFSHGLTMGILNTQIIKQILFPIPPILEQQKIASILSKVDELIRKGDQIIEQTQRLKKGLMQILLIKGIGHAKYNKIQINDETVSSPTGWNVSKLRDCTLKIGSGITPRGGSKVYDKKGIPLIRSQNVHFDGLRLDDVAFISETIHNEMKNSQLREGDVLLNITGASLGRCTIVPFGFGEGNVNQHVCIIRPNNTLGSVYLSLFLSSDWGQSTIFRTNHGLSREALNYQQIASFQIAIPPVDEQNRIAGIISSVNSRIQNETIYRITVERLKVALMQKLLTGKIRVKV